MTHWQKLRVGYLLKLRATLAFSFVEPFVLASPVERLAELVQTVPGLVLAQVADRRLERTGQVPQLLLASLDEFQYRQRLEQRRDDRRLEFILLYLLPIRRYRKWNTKDSQCGAKC